LFEQMVLVLLDLSSGYIFLEAAKDRSYQTWQDGATGAFSR